MNYLDYKTSPPQKKGNYPIQKIRFQHFRRNFDRMQRKKMRSIDSRSWAKSTRLLPFQSFKKNLNLQRQPALPNSFKHSVSF